MATAEKAVFDTLYLARVRGQRFSHLTEIELPTRNERQVPAVGLRDDRAVAASRSG
jgi:hypothetical protein